MSKPSSTATASEKTQLELLFSAILQYRSTSEGDAVIPVDGHDGAYIGSGDATLSGGRLRGTMNWSLWAGDCLYPLVRQGQPFLTACISAL